MNIAIVDSSLGAGGAEKLIVDMAPMMQKKGHDVEVIVLSSYKDVFSRILYSKNIKLNFLSNSPNYWFLSNVIKLYHALKGKDIVYVHVVHAQYFTAILTLFLSNKIKFITTEHSTHNRRRDRKLFRFFEKWIYSRYDKVISITKQVENNLLKHLDAKKNKKFVVIENGVDLDYIHSVDKLDRYKFGYSEKDKLIVMVGRFSPAKDQNTLIKSLSYLPEEYKLLFIGDGELIKESKELVRELNFDNRVNFLGFQSNIPELIKMCDVGVLSSHWEGQPLSAIEIMACGIPFVGSKVPGILELAEGYGVLFTEENSKECADIIIKLTNNKDYRNKIIQQCHKRSEEYSLVKMTAKYLNIFKEKQ